MEMQPEIVPKNQDLVSQRHFRLVDFLRLRGLSHSVFWDILQMFRTCAHVSWPHLVVEEADLEHVLYVGHSVGHAEVPQ